MINRFVWCRQPTGRGRQKNAKYGQRPFWKLGILSQSQLDGCFFNKVTLRPPNQNKKKRNPDRKGYTKDVDWCYRGFLWGPSNTVSNIRNCSAKVGKSNKKIKSISFFTFRYLARRIFCFCSIYASLLSHPCKIVEMFSQVGCFSSSVLFRALQTWPREEENQLPSRQFHCLPARETGDVFSSG